MKTAIYCRLSEEDKNKMSKSEDSLSIQNQKAMLLKYAAEQGWIVYDIYSDDDYAGADRQRPAFNRLLDDAKEHKFDIILCKTQSRFTREMELVEKYINGLFPLWGIRFVSIVDHADTDNLSNKKSRQINGLINEWYLEDMSENIRSVLKNRRQNGYHIGSFALYGYKKDPENKGHLLIDEEAAATVRNVFSLFAKGYGKTAIARILNDSGIPNPTEYKRLHGLRYQQPKSKTSTLWKYSAIADMLTNEIYIGNMVQGKYGSISYKTKQNKPRPKSEWYIVEGTHAPIIDRPLWDLVQTLIAEKAKPFSSGTVGLFAKKVRCANCGAIMRSSKNRGKQYLQCSTRHVAADICNGAFISVERLEKTVLEELYRLSTEYLDQDFLMQHVKCCNDPQKQKNHVSAELSNYQKKYDEYVQGINHLYLDKSKGILSESDFIAIFNDFTAQKNYFHSLIAEAEQKQTEIKLATEDNMQKQIDQYIHPEQLSRELVTHLIDHICIGKRIKGTQEIPIEIYWNF